MLLGAEGEEHERGDCDSETCCAPVVAAALQQRLICALTGALPSAMLRRGDDGDGSTELKVRSTSAATATARRAVLLLLQQCNARSTRRMQKNIYSTTDCKVKETTKAQKQHKYSL